MPLPGELKDFFPVALFYSLSQFWTVITRCLEFLQPGWYSDASSYSKTFDNFENVIIPLTPLDSTHVFVSITDAVNVSQTMFRIVSNVIWCSILRRRDTNGCSKFSCVVRIVARRLNWALTFLKRWMSEQKSTLASLFNWHTPSVWDQNEDTVSIRTWL